MKSTIELAQAIRSKQISAREAVGESLRQIELKNAEVNCFCHVDAEGAFAQAEMVDKKIAHGEDPGILAGVPFGVKDLEDCIGMPTALGSVFYQGRPAAVADFPHVARLRAAGAIPIGKVTTSELGFAGDCHTRACGTTRNPWNLTRTPGGSSGGSAAAVAAGIVPFCTSSDGGGSARGPASFTGLVGYKPSHGRVPNANGASENAAFAALATSVADVARTLDVMAGPDDRDRMTLPAPTVNYEQSLKTLDIEGLRVVWSGDLGAAVVDTEVIEIAGRAAENLIATVNIRRVNFRVDFTNIMPAVIAIYVDRLRTRLTMDGFLPDRFEELSDANKAFFSETGPLSSEDLYRYRLDILKLEKEVAAAYCETDIILCPTTACPAFNAEGPWPRVIDGRDASRTGDAPLTSFANFAWNPSISVPAGFTRDGLPVGLMITGPRHRDDIVLRIAHLFEKTQPWPRLAPM